MNDLEGFGFVLPHWAYWGWLCVMPLLLLYAARNSIPELLSGGEARDSSHTHGNRFTHAIDWLSNASGLMVAMWTINAVVFYFFEVTMRYVFNSPTIWVHESSYLLFGMQYLLTGAFALLHGAHVRVDIVYSKLPPRGQVGMDIFTAVVFMVFALALLGTSWTFLVSSFEMREVSLETWGIQYWPVKLTMFIGAFLLLLAGLSKLIKDILRFKQMGERAVQ